MIAPALPRRFTVPLTRNAVSESGGFWRRLTRIREWPAHPRVARRCASNASLA